jgi:transposase
MGFGRPSKYNPDMCAKVVEMMTIGCSMVEVAAELGVCFDTVHEWRNVYPDFSEAIRKGELLSQAWWEKNGRVNLENTRFNTALWTKNMAGRFAKNGWGEKTQIGFDPEQPLTIKSIEVNHVK